MSEPGRNEPCPCGSGRKYKHCCRGKDPSGPIPREAVRAHDRINSLADRLTTYARRRFGSQWLADVATAWFGGAFEDDEFEHEKSAFHPWALYDRDTSGAPVARWYLNELGANLEPADRELLETLLASCWSMWEALDIQPGRGLTMRDLLTGETRFVTDINASQSLDRWGVVLGRVVDAEGLSLFDGVYPQPLPPAEAGRILKLARASLGVRTRAVPRARLREAKIDLDLVLAWRALVADMMERPLPQVVNTQGDPLLLTTDRFEFAPPDRDAIVSRVAALADGQVDREDGRDVVTLTRPDAGGKATLAVARIVIDSAWLLVETNSIARADAARAQMEAACGPLVQHRIRKHVDPMTLIAKGEAPGRPPSRAEIPDDVRARIVREFKEKHYAEWVDVALPALNGKTPRAAAKTAAGRTSVDALLKKMEFHEQRLPAEERFDFARLRQELGLDVVQSPRTTA